MVDNSNLTIGITISDDDYNIINDMVNLLVSYLNVMTDFNLEKITIYNPERDWSGEWTKEQLSTLHNMVDSL